MTGTTLGSQPIPSIDLYWIPLGAGQHVVRFTAEGYQPQSRVIALAGKDRSKLHVDLKKTASTTIIVGV